MSSPINDIGFNATFRKGPIDGLESEAALTHPQDIDQVDSDATLDSSAVPGPKPEIELRPSPYKAFHIFEIDGQQYLITEFDHDGKDTKFIGHLPEDWEEKAKAAKEIFDARKKADPKCEVREWAHQLGTKTHKFRTSTSETIETVDFSNPSSVPATCSTLQPFIDKMEEIFKRVNQKGQNFTIHNKNPPKPVLACQQKPQKPVKQPFGPLNQPEPPPPGKFERFKTWVNKLPFFRKKDPSSIQP